MAQVLARQLLQFPMQLKMLTDDETRQYHRKKLYELSLKSLGKIPQLDEPTDEQKRWVKHRMNGPAWTWKRWYE